MKKILVWVVIAVLAVGVSLLFLQPDQTKTQATSAAESQAYSQLATQLSTLTREKNQLRSEYEKKIVGLGTLSLVFTDIDALLMDRPLPLMEQSGLTGVLAFSCTKYPGAQGCITMEKWLELKEKGWESCLYWDGEAPLDTCLSDASRQLTQLGLDMPDTLYSASGALSEEQMDALTTHGVRTLIYTTEETDVFMAEMPVDGVWVLGGMPYTVNKAGTQSNSINAAGGSLAMLVPDTVELMSERLSLFESMVQTLANRHAMGTALITTITGARVQRQQNIADREALEKERDAKLLEIEEQINEVNRQINALLNEDK